MPQAGLVSLPEHLRPNGTKNKAKLRFLGPNFNLSQSTPPTPKFSLFIAFLGHFEIFFYKFWKFFVKFQKIGTKIFGGYSKIK